jgi:hypothetical protein
MGLYKKAWMAIVSALARVSENVAHLFALISAAITVLTLMYDKGALHVILFASFTLAAEVFSTAAGFARRHLDKLERNAVKQELNDIQCQMKKLQEYTKARLISGEAKALLADRIKNSNKRFVVSFTYDNAFDSAATALMLMKVFRECGWTAFDEGPLMVGQADARDLLVVVNAQNRSFAETFSNWLAEAGFPSEWSVYGRDPPAGQIRVVVYRTSNKLGS